MKTIGISNLPTTPNIHLLDGQLQTGTDVPVRHFVPIHVGTRHA